MFFGQQAQFSPSAIATGPQETNSPVFASLIDQMSRKENLAILDLGPARASKLQLWSQFHCKLFIEDAHDLVPEFTGDQDSDKNALKNWLIQWTANAAKGSISVVLVWDLLNYLDPQQCKIFVDHLTPLLQPGAQIYLTVYSQKDMPTLPMRFDIISADRMEYATLTRDVRSSPRFNQTDLQKRLPNFSVTKSVLLRNGIQEYLLKY